jgi:hypothetical protein
MVEEPAVNPTETTYVEDTPAHPIADTTNTDHFESRSYDEDETSTPDFSSDYSHLPGGSEELRSKVETLEKLNGELKKTNDHLQYCLTVVESVSS